MQRTTTTTLSQTTCGQVPRLHLPGHLPCRTQEVGRNTMPSEVIELSGHIIDSWTLPRAWDVIMDRGGNFDVEKMSVGKTKTEHSYARLKVTAPNDETLEIILSELQQLGAVILHGDDAETAAVEQHGVLPAKFYS